MQAVCMGDVALCRLLLDARADVAQRSRAGSTAQAEDDGYGYGVKTYMENCLFLDDFHMEIPTWFIEQVPLIFDY